MRRLTAPEPELAVRLLVRGAKRGLRRVVRPHTPSTGEPEAVIYDAEPRPLRPPFGPVERDVEPPADRETAPTVEAVAFVAVVYFHCAVSTRPAASVVGSLPVRSRSFAGERQLRRRSPGRAGW